MDVSVAGTNEPLSRGSLETNIELERVELKRTQR